MNIDLQPYKEAFSRLPKEIREAEVNADVRDELEIEFSNGKQTRGEAHEQIRLYVRVNGEGTGTGTVYSEQLSENPDKLIREAYENSFFSSSNNHEPMISGESYRKEVCLKGNHKKMLALAHNIEKKALLLPEVAEVANCTIRKTLRTMAVVNSKGLDRYHENGYFMISLSLLLHRKNGEHQNASSCICVSSLEEVNENALIAQAVKSGNLSDFGGLPELKISSGTYRAVLSNEVMKELVYSMWKIFSATEMQAQSVFLSDEPHQKIGSPLLNIIDTPKVPSWGYDLSLDCEGSLGTHQYVVKNGLLEMPLYNLSSAQASLQKLQKSTGNAGRTDFYTAVIPLNILTIPKILYIEQGESTEDQLFHKLQDGLFINYSTDANHAVSHSTGDFSIPCGGIVFRNGKPIGSCSQLVLTGNLRELFSNIEAVGNDLFLEEFDFAENFCYGAPSLLFSSVSISA